MKIPEMALRTYKTYVVIVCLLSSCFMIQNIYFCILLGYSERQLESYLFYYYYESRLWTFCARVPSGVEYEWNKSQVRV